MISSYSDLSCFRGSYRDARQCLLDTLHTLPAELLQQHETVIHPLPGPDQQALYLDWLWLGQNKNPEQLLVMISGTHGVEGFTGSAIQSHWLPYLSRQLEQSPETGIIILHALNPWGFAWLRRYDHEGIDLNRNFIDFNQPLPENPVYDEVHDELFGSNIEPVLNTFNRWQSKLGREDFTAQFTRGQYQHADGLFYGGNASSWSRRTLEQLALGCSPLQTARRVAVIDLHTGLGPYGYGEVINDHAPDHPGFELAKRWYGANAQSAYLGESCSAPKTGLLDYFWHELISARGSFITLEFGTYTTEQLLALSCEEQRYHNSCDHNLKQRNLENDSVKALHDFFYPTDRVWRELVLFRAGQIIQLALQGIEH